MRNEPTDTVFRTASLPTRKPQRFRFAPDAEARRALAADLGITAIGELAFEGEIKAAGRDDFRLEGRLRAQVEQPCVVSLAPVKTRIDTPVKRTYSASFVLPDAEESETPEDETIDPLPDAIDVADVAAEALALSLPDWPRAEGAELGEAIFTAPGTAPMRDEDLRPFAGLQALKDKLKDGN